MAADKKDAKKNKVEAPKKGVPVKKKNKKVVTEGIIFIHASFNNTIVNLTDQQGNSLAQHSSGAAGFSGSRKHTPFAGQVAAEKIALLAKTEYKMEKVDVRVKGPGPARDSATRAISMAGLEVTSITDETPIPHNGCRPSKRRRI